MDALILAAGMGTRLRDVAPCKPLTRVHGVTLLEIAVRQLALAGASRVRVATGYQAEQVEAALPGIARRVGVAVAARRVPDYRLPNGHSVLAGAAGLTGDFLLVMADHVLSHAILRALAACPLDGRGAILAVDRRIASPLIDPDDATWVALDEAGCLARIGKALQHYHAVDCGAFRASPALLEAINAAIAAGQPGSLTDGMQRLADQRRAGTVDIGDAWWIDVDDPRALRLATEQAPQHLPHLFERAEARASMSTAA